MSKIVKVLNITKSWGSKTQIEGISTVIMNLYRNMNHEKIQFHVANINLNSSIFDEEIKSYGGQVYNLTEPNIRNSKWAVCKKLINLIKKNKYNAVYIHVSMAYDAWWMVLIYLFTNVPVRIVHSHNAGLNNDCGDKIRLLLNLLMKPILSVVCTDFFACSLTAADWAFSKRSFKKKGKIIKNAIEINKFRFSDKTRQEIRKQYNWQNYMVLGNVGRISYQKNQEFLIDLIGEINKYRPTKLVLIGGGSDSDIFKLKQKIRSKKLEEKVCFLGVQSDVNKYLCGMDCFVFPSNYEGLGITAVEAQANGLPTICSDRVPIEAKTTDLFKRVSLDKPLSDWCEIILSSVNYLDHKNTTQDLIKGGYDIKNVSIELEDYLICEVHKYEK